MYETKRVLGVCLCLTLILISINLVAAARELTYQVSPNETYGDWDTYDDVTEENVSGIYRCYIVFVFSNVPEDADDYYIEIDYDGHTPGYPWNAESLKAQYRWGTTGSWNLIAFFDIFPSEYDWDISDPNSSTLQLRFVDCITTSDSTQHTWYFGDLPALCMYYE